ncbi:Spo0B domain-containing protein [Paenibacillus sp. DMB20]|uniref:Spo0B domain-containing protein n=1 Tax=Paenibacillus sp. DMB20 TaxID=1642570 RepID=UPI000627ECAA|nr:Spo0B domain-containing protein [Paenibacillus sp. DMB20]KKO51864.1 hypothetical protein XI25_23375 [Paenibacillus sp. DMB20]
MNSWRWIAAGIGLTVLMPAAWMLWNPTLGAAVAVVVWSVAAALCSAWLVRHGEMRKQHAIRLYLENSLEQRAIQMLNHHRHDWMNELQILYGYIQLGKHDKSVHCVERIKERMLQDSKISKLGIPSLVFYLHSYRTYNTGLQLEVEVVDHVQLEGKLSPDIQETLTDTVMAVLRAYQDGGSSSWEEDRQLILTFMEQDEELIVEFEGEGAFGDADSMKQRIEMAVNNKEIRVEQVDTGHTTYRLRVPYVT